MSPDRCGIAATEHSKCMYRLGRGALLALVVLPLLRPGGAAAQPEIVVAVQPDTPPYVMQGATRGIEIELVRTILEGQKLRFIQMPYAELESAVAEKKADMAVGVRHIADGVAYSKDFITFANYAISRKADDLKIDAVADLRGHPVLAWQDAADELGEEFAALFSPRARAGRNYAEVGDQEEQVRRFWRTNGAVLVIDRSVFGYFNAALGHSTEEVTFHDIFVGATNFKVGFKDPNTRDEFDQRLTALCASGDYQKILARYHVDLPTTVCEWRRAAVDRIPRSRRGL